MKRYWQKYYVYIVLVSFIINVISISYIVISQYIYSQDVLGTNNSLSGYPFLSKRISLDGYDNDLHINFVPLRTALRSYVEGQSENISIYFEYLPSGSSIGINEDKEMLMASLIKVPTIMMIYNKIANGELSKDTMLTLEERHIDKQYGDFWEEGVGATISVEDAIHKSFIESDNTTHQMLFSLLNEEDQRNLFNNIDMRVSEENGVFQSFTSAKSYASILKSLYYSTFLPAEYSNEILNILRENHKSEGITQDIPDNIDVSRKSGIINSEIGDIINDCAIFHYPNRPYVLCISAAGTNTEEMLKHISTVSKFVYTYIRDINNE